MILTFPELIEELYEVDEVTLLETMGITSEELVNKFLDRVEEMQEELQDIVNDRKEGFNIYDYEDNE